MRIYIASPYSNGDQVLNVRAQIEAADKLLEMGHSPFIPCLSHFWHFVSPKSYEEWLKIDLDWLEVCDAILRLPGESNGADKEVIHAYSRGLSIYYDIKDVPEEVE